MKEDLLKSLGRRPSIYALVGALALIALPAVARQLYWEALEVTAHLDADGSLRVSETHRMVFDGDWNGGERRFRRSPDQPLELLEVLRLDPLTGQARALDRGDLDEVDHYDWIDRTTLRWRSRLPSDPPFNQENLTYRLIYTMGHVLRPAGEGYRLDHDFAFPDRAGTIRRFTLELSLDPVWQPIRPLPPRLEIEDLLPGSGAVVTTDLVYQGSGSPAGVPTPVPLIERRALFAAVPVVMLALYLRFRRNEAALGRFSTPVTPPIDSGWLEENLLDLSPEEVGALWDRRTGAAEVAAVLARMVSEGKLESSVRKGRNRFSRGVLELRLEVDRSTLEGHERQLIDKLFFGAGNTTDTAAIRAHYKSKGFNPAETLRPILEQRLGARAGLADKTPPPRSGPTLTLFALAAALLAVQAIWQPWGTWKQVLSIGLGLGIFYLPGLVLAFAWRRRVSNDDAGSLGFLLPGVGFGLYCAAIVFFGDRLGSPETQLLPGRLGCLALALLSVGVFLSLLNNARTREGPQALRKRQLLGLARRHLQDQLALAWPQISDDWLPYLIALGLQRRMDRWFRAHGAAAGSAPAGDLTWTGGGSSFRGAGTSWSRAASGLAAGVAPPGSSSSGGGGSTGGGGGGGW